MSSFVHDNNENKDILNVSEGPTQELLVKATKIN